MVNKFKVKKQKQNNDQKEFEKLLILGCAKQLFWPGRILAFVVYAV